MKDNVYNYNPGIKSFISLIPLYNFPKVEFDFKYSFPLSVILAEITITGISLALAYCAVIYPSFYKYNIKFPYASSFKL